MIWMEWMIAVAVCALSLTAAYYAWKDKDTVSSSVASLTEATMFVARRFQAAIALMLGFYTIQAFTRWREARTIAGNAMGTINDLALQIALRIRIVENETCSDDSDAECDNKNTKSNGNEHSDGKVNNSSKHKDTDVVRTRLKLIRWLNLSHALVVGDVYEMKHNAFSSLKNLVAYGLATEKECAFLKTQDTRYKYVAPLLWFVDLVVDLQKKELHGMDGGTENLLSNGVVGLRRQLADLYALKFVPIPLSYRQLTNLTVRLYMIILLIAAVLFEKSDDYALGQLSSGSFWILLIYGFEYLLFVGWLTVADAVGNPYRAWADQLDWDDYVKELNLNSMLIATRFHGAAWPVDLSDEESDDESEKLVETCHRWDESLNKIDTKPARGFKARRKLATGF